MIGRVWNKSSIFGISLKVDFLNTERELGVILEVFSGMPKK